MAWCVGPAVYEIWHKQVIDFKFDGHLHVVHHICIVSDGYSQ